MKLAPLAPTTSVAPDPHSHVVLLAVQLTAEHDSELYAWSAASQSRQLGTGTVEQTCGAFQAGQPVQFACGRRTTNTGRWSVVGSVAR